MTARTEWKWIAVYVYAWLGLQSVYVCVLCEERCLDEAAREVKAFQSTSKFSVEHEGQSITCSLQTTICQQTHPCCLHYSRVSQQENKMSPLITWPRISLCILDNLIWGAAAQLASVSSANVLKTKAQRTVKGTFSIQEVKDGKPLWCHKPLWAELRAVHFLLKVKVKV